MAKEASFQHNCGYSIAKQLSFFLFFYIRDLFVIESKFKSVFRFIFCVLLETSTIITASLDTTVVAYDLNYQKIKFILTTHKRGLISMAYKESYNILVTAAAEHSWYNLLCFIIFSQHFNYW